MQGLRVSEGDRKGHPCDAGGIGGASVQMICFVRE